MERAINVSGKSNSTLTNYARQLAHFALHYNCMPTQLDCEQVLDYLHLIKSKGTRSATFFKFTVFGMRKDYKHGSVKKEMPLDAMEFIRCFSMHILPKGFVRIRHFVILSSTAKERSLTLIKAQLPAQSLSVNESVRWPFRPNEALSVMHLKSVRRN